MSENLSNNLVNESIGNLENVISETNISSSNELNNKETTSDNTTNDSAFKVVGTNLPAKPSIWTKIKNILFYEIKVELTPYQQKIENEINDFLHQEITWKSLKEAALSEVPITFRGKRIF